MAFEARLAGLELEPYERGWNWSDIKTVNVSDSMTQFWKIAEYLPFSWIDESGKSVRYVPT